MTTLRQNRDPKKAELTWIATELAMVAWNLDLLSRETDPGERARVHSLATRALAEAIATTGALIEADLGGAE